MKKSTLLSLGLITGGLVGVALFMSDGEEVVPEKTPEELDFETMMFLDWVSNFGGGSVSAEVEMSSYLNAFLFMLKASEHDLSDARDGTAYRAFYSHSPSRPNLFSNMRDHPVITGEKKGVKLPDRMCKAAGYRSGCVSTAAGAYQIIRPTWDEVRVAGVWGPRLPDFSEASQDEAARRILMKIGALDLIEVGALESAIALASKKWASLPGSTADQGGRSMDYALSRFNEGLANA